MLEELYFSIGVINNIFLILIFLIRKNENLALLKKVGGSYFLLAIPSLYAIFLVQLEGKSTQYTVFLLIFLTFLTLEGVYDFILKIPFRKYWKLLTPYLLLYFAMNYGFVVLVWKQNFLQGILLLGLFIIQIMANAWSHPRTLKKKTH
jgi:hypothetical protein